VRTEVSSIGHDEVNAARWMEAGGVCLCVCSRVESVLVEEYVGQRYRLISLSNCGHLVGQWAVDTRKR
jgi:hypothetical protein